MISPIVYGYVQFISNVFCMRLFDAYIVWLRLCSSHTNFFPMRLVLLKESYVGKVMRMHCISSSRGSRPRVEQENNGHVSIIVILINPIVAIILFQNCKYT